MNINNYTLLMYGLAFLAASSILVPFFSRWRRTAGILNFFMVTLSAVMMLNISYNVIFKGSVPKTELLNFGIININFYIDSVSAFFIAIIAFMSVISALYSIEYLNHYKEYSLRGYYFFYPLFVAGMACIVTVDDLTTGFTIGWQLMTIASYFLVRFEKNIKANIKNANKYLMLMEVAFLSIIAAVMLVDEAVIGEPLHSITQKIGNSGMMAYVIYGLLLLGFAFKAGIFPLGQLWLPDAHSIAPSPVSALLSGVMIKTGVYGIIRTFFWMVPNVEGQIFNGTLWGIVISSLGVLTLFIGTVQSMKQCDAKRLLAYSSIGQIGYIVFAIGASLFCLYAESETLQFLAVILIIGVLYHVLNHAVFKGLLFLSSGSVLYATGTKDLNKLGGLLKFMPITGIIAAIGSLSISGVPPFSGFSSKWTIISSNLIAGKEAPFLVVFGIIALFTSAITLSCYVKFFGMTFTSEGAKWNTSNEIKEVPASMIFSKLVLTILCIVQGIIPYIYFKVIATIFMKTEGSTLTTLFQKVPPMDYISNNILGVKITLNGSVQTTISLITPIVIAVVVIVSFLFAIGLKKSGGSVEKETSAWLCGYQELHNGNRYKNKNMFAALKRALWWTGGNVKE